MRSCTCIHRKHTDRTPILDTFYHLHLLNPNTMFQKKWSRVIVILNPLIKRMRTRTRIHRIRKSRYMTTSNCPLISAKNHRVFSAGILQSVGRAQSFSLPLHQASLYRPIERVSSRACRNNFHHADVGIGETRRSV